MRRYDDDRPREWDDDEPLPPDPPSNGMATASLVLGIVGFCVTPICGLLAIVLGAVGLSRSKTRGVGRGMATAGLVIGVVSGVVEPAVIGIVVYRAMVLTAQAADRVIAEGQENLRKAEAEQKARQKMLDDERRAQQKAVQDEHKRNQDDVRERMRKADADRERMEAENKERMRKFDEDRKKTEEERKLNGEVSKARSMCFSLEFACRAYLRANNNTPPKSLEDLPQPKTGKALEFTDPWGKPYQLDVSEKDDQGRPVPQVFTLHPQTGEKITTPGKAKQ